MGDRDLADLLRRRLFELGVTAAEVSRRSRGEAPAETVRGLARSQRSLRVGDRFAWPLARTPLGLASVPRRCGVEVVEGGATLVIAGSSSPPGLGSVARILAAALPDARFVELDGSGHVTHLEMSDEFAATVAAFPAEIQIDRHTASTRARRSPSHLVTTPPRR
jgi:pimeloyl-ACP methyl ester carboxylesterase